MYKTTAQHTQMFICKRVTNSAFLHVLRPFIAVYGANKNDFHAFLRPQMAVWDEKVHALHAMPVHQEPPGAERRRGPAGSS
jgi:hypothetical protein